MSLEDLDRLPFDGDDAEEVRRPRMLVYKSRGELHADPACQDAGKDPAPFSASIRTLARHGWLCRCFDRTAAMRPVSELISSLAGLVERLPGDVPADVWLPDVVAELEHLRSLLDEPGDWYPPFKGTRQRLDALILSRRTELESRLRSPEGRAEATRLLALLAAGAAPALDGAIPKGVLHDLPYVGPASDPKVPAARSAAFNSWLRALASGRSRAEAAEGAWSVLHAEISAVPLRVNQLPPTLPRAPLPGESTSEYLTAVWESGVRSTFDDLEASWYADFEAALEAAESGETTLLLVDPSRASDPFLPVAVASFSVGKVTEWASSGLHLLQLPSVLAAALCARPASRGMLAGTPDFLVEALPGEPGDTPAVLETALALWEPKSAGPLARLAAALDTARAAVA